MREQPQAFAEAIFGAGKTDELNASGIEVRVYRRPRRNLLCNRAQRRRS